MLKQMFLLILILIIASCTSSVDQAPAEIVSKYFEAWNQKDYAVMYAQVSEGFKKIEKTANTFEDFKKYASSQPIQGVKINSVKALTNDGREASVAYEVEYKINEEWNGYSGTFTLKLKENGWKLIHPYGENKDES